jgi:tetratricopeptide (TPR) repeat protein
VAEAARANEARLLQQSKARESVAQAAILLAEGKIDDADALLVKTPLASLEPSVEAVSVFRSLGEWNAIRQRWTKAAECYAFFLKASGFRRVPEAEIKWILMAVGCAQVEAGNLDAYEEFRDQAISNYGKSTDYIFSAIVLKSCLLAPGGTPILGRLQANADQVDKELASSSPDAIDAEQGAFAAMSMALMEYRKGNFTRAQEWCRKSMDFPDSNQARSATIHAIRALAAQKLGQPDLAKSELTRARVFFNGPLAQDSISPRGEGQGFWQDWAIARVLVREAENFGK